MVPLGVHLDTQVALKNCPGVIEHWNKLPENVINVNSINSFKNKVDKYLSEKERDE